MNNLQLSERESGAQTHLQIHLRREPLETVAIRRGSSRPANPEIVADVLRSASAAVPSAGGTVNSIASLRPGPERLDARQEPCADAARAALDSCAGRTLTDAEWAVAQGKLLEFVTILRGWGQRSRTASRDLLMFEVPCLPEL
jgi:hypothetical protein